MAAVKHVVLDSGAFLRNAKVQDIGENVYTLPDVVSEIKDKATKQRLQVLPYDLVYREPSSDAVRIVTEFSKKTGDYRSLSAVDIRVMALVYQLEKELVGTDHLKSEPDKKVQWTSTKMPLEKATDIAGFYVKPKKVVSSRTESECSSVRSEHLELRTSGEPEKTVENEIDPNKDLCVIENDSKPAEKTEDDVSEITVTTVETNDINDKLTKENEDSLEKNNSDVLNRMDNIQEGDTIPEDMIEEETDSEQSDDDDDDDDDDDGGGWITPGNIKTVKDKMGGDGLEIAQVKVGCLTTDFAMQNVLIQMGLNVISVDGMLIKRAKSYVLRCFGCFRITTNVEKTFCPHCGNKTLTKVSMTVNDDGSIKYFLSRRRPINLKGTKYKLPLPKGGKHGANPHLVEDQPEAQNRISRKARMKMDVFDPDYIANSSPFAVNDVTSRAAQLGIRSHKGQSHYWERRNPNAVRKNRRK